MNVKINVKNVEQAGVKIDYNFIVTEMIKKIPTFDIKDEDIKLVKDKVEKEIVEAEKFKAKLFRKILIAVDF